jgi:hypothetical protein
MTALLLFALAVLPWPVEANALQRPEASSLGISVSASDSASVLIVHGDVHESDGITHWGDGDTSVSTSDSTNVLIVYGDVYESDGATHWGDGDTVAVENLDTGVSVESIIGTTESGKYGAVFIDTEGNAAARVGESLRFELRGGSLIAQATHVLTTEDIEAGRLGYDIVTEVSCQSGEIELKAGWNWASVYRDPEVCGDASMDSVWQGEIEQGILNIVKNRDGWFFAPPYGFCNIAPTCDWDPLEMYAVHVDTATLLTVERPLVDPCTTLEIDYTWNWVHYLLPYPCYSWDLLNATPCIWLLKNDEGEFCVPEYSYCSMDSLLPGEGYKLWTEGACDLVYCTACGGGAASAETYVAPMESNRMTIHFRPVSQSHDSYSMLIDGRVLEEAGLTAGDEVGVFTGGGLCVGAVNWLGERQLGIAAWMDDEGTMEVDGWTGGEEIMVRAYSAELGEEIELLVSYELGDGRYGTGPLAVLVPAGEGIEVRGNVPVLYQSEPNPFSHEAVIRYYLPREGRVSVTVFDVTGKKVSVLADGHKGAGEGSVVWDGRDETGREVAAGVYLYRMEIEGRILSKKLMLVR